MKKARLDTNLWTENKGFDDKHSYEMICYDESRYSNMT